MSSNKDNVTNCSSNRLIGRVKWFNNKAGYGFITVTDGERSGSDIFVHHSVVNVENQQYKYLIQGEYVEFDLVRTASVQHEWQASNVSGIKCGKLMCETRHENKSVRNDYKTSKSEDVKKMNNEKETTNLEESSYVPHKNSGRQQPSKFEKANTQDWKFAGRKGRLQKERANVSNNQNK